MTSPVLAVLWFDTEDFVNPETDDSPLRIAKLMEKHGIRVVFKIVGEKLRALKRNGREDVIEALSRHEVGYHGDTHSIHPVISEYVGNLGWDEGAKEFEERERTGYEEAKGTFGRELSCYGHPGLCWVPQAYPVLKKWNIPVYLDETHTITPIHHRPFWYCNILNLMCLGSNVITLDAGVTTYDIPDDWLVRFRSEFRERYKKLRRESEPGIISVYCHPTTYYTKVWWEKPNFLGKNPTGMRFTRVSLKSKERVEGDFRDLEEFVAMAKKLPSLRFITALDALRLYADKAKERRFTINEVSTLCERGVKAINYERVSRGVWVSPAETFSMVLQALSTFSKTGKMPKFARLHSPLGPKRSVRTICARAALALPPFLKACEREFECLRRTNYLPDASEVGGATLSTPDYFATACAAVLALAGGISPKKLRPRKGRFIVGRSVTIEGARKDWAYQLNPRGFEAPRQTELARLQAWTMKPASPDAELLRRL